MRNTKTELDALIEISEKTGVSFITNESVTGKYFRALLNKYRMPLLGENYDDYANAILSGQDVEVEQTAYMLGGLTAEMLFKSIESLIQHSVDYEKASEFFSRHVNRYMLVEDSTLLRYELAAMVNTCVLFIKQ